MVVDVVVEQVLELREEVRRGRCVVVGTDDGVCVGELSRGDAGRVRVDHHVGVDEQHDRGVGQRAPDVACRCGAGAASELMDPDAVTLRPCDVVGQRPVGHDQHLGGGRFGSSQTRETGVEVVAAAEHGDDDAHVGRRWCSGTAGRGSRSRPYPPSIVRPSPRGVQVPPA